MKWEDKHAVGWCKLCGKRLRKTHPMFTVLICKKCSRDRAKALPARGVE